MRQLLYLIGDGLDHPQIFGRKNILSPKSDGDNFIGSKLIQKSIIIFQIIFKKIGLQAVIESGVNCKPSEEDGNSGQ